MKKLKESTFLELSFIIGIDCYVIVSYLDWAFPKGKIGLLNIPIPIIIISIGIILLLAVFTASMLRLFHIEIG